MVAVVVLVVVDVGAVVEAEDTVDADAADGTRRGRSPPRRQSVMVLRFSGSGYSLVSSGAPSGTLGLGTSATAERF